MGTFIDLAGATFGQLTVLWRDNNRDAKNVYWVCCCTCGVMTSVQGGHLRDGKIQSCGCESAVQRTHGLAGTPEAAAWLNARERCTNPEDPNYARYGGRGITMYDGWLNSPVAFVEYMGPRPSPAHSLDRKDNNGNYEPGNVRWATKKEQSQNREVTLWVQYDGQRRPVLEVCQELGLVYNTIHSRIINGMSPEEAISIPVQKYDKKNRP